MAILQAPPTSQPVTHRAAALARGDGSARAVVAVPQPGERGHLQHALMSAIAVRHYSRRTAQAYWHWTRQFVLWSGKRHPLEMGAPEVGAFLSHLATDRDVSASTQRQAKAAMPPRSQIDYYWPLAREACGLQHVRLHDIRHSTASEIIAAGGDLGDVGAVLNHKTPASSARYAHWLLARKAAVVGKIGRKVG